MIGGGIASCFTNFLRAYHQCKKYPLQDELSFSKLFNSTDFSQHLKMIDLNDPPCFAQVITTVTTVALTLGAVAITAKVAKMHFANHKAS